MDTKKSTFNRILLSFLIVLFVLTIAGLSYMECFASSGQAQWWMMLLNIPIMSIPLVLLFGSIFVLVAGWREHAAFGQVSPRLAKIIRWAPRVAAILIIFFISLFSLDVFEMGGSALEVLGGFIIHNIPSFLLIALLILSWKRPFVGFVAFLAAAAVLAIFFLGSIFSRGGPNQGAVFSPGMLLFVLPVLFIAGLFYAEWRWLKPQPPAQVSAAT